MTRTIKISLGAIFTVLAFVPITVPIFLTIILFASERILRYDFFMPAELFYFTVIGAIGMIVIAKLNKISAKRIVILALLYIGSIVGAQLFAFLTGLATGEVELEGMNMYLTIGLLSTSWHILALLIAIECIRILKMANREISG